MGSSKIFPDSIVNSSTEQLIENISPNMFVHAGQQIVEISPAGQLVAECYVSTKDIGLIHVQQKTRIYG